MAEIKFYANIIEGGEGTLINHAAGSGIGFYGAGFAISVPVGSKQTTTFVTDSTGANQGAQLNNTTYITSGNAGTAGTVSVNGTIPAINLNNLPNYLCPLNVRFTHSEAVKVQNCKLRVFDRNNIANQATGVVTYIYEARHPSQSQAQGNLGHRGRNDNSWYEFDPVDAMTDMSITASPGVSGTNTNSQDTSTALGYLTTQGSLHSSLRHDWYLALSSEPVTIGSKTQYGLYFTVEYL